jgi:arylformamidase
MPSKPPKGWYDITVPIKQNMISMPIDPVKPKIYRYSDANLGSKVTMTMLEIMSHTGTHLDSPLHFIPGGSTISDVPLDATIGPARVIEIKDRQMIKVSELRKHNIKKGERVLFKTRNSPASYAGETWMEDYVYFDPSAARYLAKLGIVLVGLDCLTIGYFKDDDNINSNHHAFLDAGIYILENCALGDVPPGEYELLCMPLLIYHGDASPCRAILRPLKAK